MSLSPAARRLSKKDRIDGALHLMGMVAREAADDGWAAVSSLVWPALELIPQQLLERDGNGDNGGRCRLTEEGRIALKWRGHAAWDVVEERAP